MLTSNLTDSLECHDELKCTAYTPRPETWPKVWSNLKSIRGTTSIQNPNREPPLYLLYFDTLGIIYLQRVYNSGWMCPTAVAAPSEAVSGQRQADKQRQINHAGCILRLLYGWQPLKWITNGSDGGKKKKDKLPQGRQRPVCLTRAGERRNKDGGLVRGRVGQEWETRAAEEREMSREPWEVSLLRHSWGDGPVNAQPGGPREEDSTGIWMSRSYFSSNLPDEKDGKHANASEEQRAQTLQSSQRRH